MVFGVGSDKLRVSMGGIGKGWVGRGLNKLGLGGLRVVTARESSQSPLVVRKGRLQKWKALSVHPLSLNTGIAKFALQETLAVELTLHC